MRREFWATIVLTVALGTTSSEAQTWPARQIELIMPWPAGSGVDVIARAMAQAIAAELGQNIVVLNRDGASGTIGFNTLASASADGYTLGAGPTTPIANAPYLVKGARYQVTSFNYICQYYENVFALAVPRASRFKSVDELFAAAREAPGKLAYGHAGVGSIPHLSVENLSDALGLKFQSVPFRGETPMLPVLIGGDLDFGSVSLASVRDHDLRVLAVFAGARRAGYPEAPSIKELGVATFVPPGHNGLFAPAGLPEAVRVRLEQACANATKDEGVLRTMAGAGQTITFLDSAKFREQTLADYKFKGEIIRRLGLEAN
ncbi:MAG: tripartite tricarboxylate transporter substrate binding protein [Xanthobacteraceae bacterium]|nr:tripartite tricarboxylate transporter substrate binding protein [Xanthobacteraceae bacterium]MBV9628180.1 tripartite tricarboxylate transporter substrate binding protein [Xanthobacteraceae bacterium]